MLHMDVFRQRLEDEFSVEAILTSPSVPYKCKIRREDVNHTIIQKIIDIDSAA
jgi:translation elongation factor EF-4